MNVDLEARLRRLMFFRVVIVTTLLFVATSVEAVSETLLPVNPVYFVIVATYGLTVVYAVALRVFGPRRLQAYAQVVGDLLIITALVSITPRERLGFVPLYPLAVLSATLLVSRRGALFFAALATALYGTLLAAVKLEAVGLPGLADVPSDGRSARDVPGREPPARGATAAGGGRRGGGPA
jgi:two-component system sensor histidine kinase PilS (NtrC family)